MATEAPSLPPTANVNVTDGFIEAELAEEEHEFDAISSLVLNITIILCLLLAYFVKKYRFYYLPESAGALLVGIVIGGIATLTTDNLQLFEFVSLLSNACCSRPCLFHSLTLSRGIASHRKSSSFSYCLRLSLKQATLVIVRDSLRISVQLLCMPCLAP
jgi:Na+/glutamate symporter